MAPPDLRSRAPGRASTAELENVEVRYDGRVALSRVSLVLGRGRYGLVGPSGAGKSTLIKALLGVVPATHGRVRVLGRDVSTSGVELRARIGYMPEGDSVLEDLSALEYVRLAGELCGLPRTEATARAHEMLSYVGLDEVRYRVLAGFSTGMRQRARLAQALVSAPELLLLDEPTSGLDPVGRAEMLALIEDIPRRSGATVLLSTHILPDVERTCDQVIVLAQGCIRYAGALAPMLESESRRYVVRVRSETATLVSLLKTAGCDVEGDAGELTVRVPEGADAQLVLRVAVENGLQVRHLAPFSLTLDEAFRKTVSAPGGRP